MKKVQTIDDIDENDFEHSEHIQDGIKVYKVVYRYNGTPYVIGNLAKSPTLYLKRLFFAAIQRNEK